MWIVVECAEESLKHWLSQAVALFHSPSFAPSYGGRGAVELLPTLPHLIKGKFFNSNCTPLSISYPPHLPPLSTCLIFFQVHVDNWVAKKISGVKSRGLPAIGHKILALLDADHDLYSYIGPHLKGRIEERLDYRHFDSILHSVSSPTLL